MKNKITVIPDTRGGACRTGTLLNTKSAEITKILGFKPNVEDDPNKVVNSWGFTVAGTLCGIWDYKGSHKWGQYSTNGPTHIFKALFGEKYQNG